MSHKTHDPAALKSKTRLVFVRHAESYANIDKVWHGQTDTELTDKGYGQIEQLGAGFHQHMSPDVIYASPLQRTRHTAQAIADRHGLELQLDPRLMEFHLGDWEGTRFSELREKMNSIRDPHFEAPGGESQLLVKNRMVQAIEEIYQNHQGENIVLVSHGVAMAVAFAHYLHGDVTRWVEYTTHNTAVSELCLTSNKLLSFNDSGHLGDD